MKKSIFNQTERQIVRFYQQDFFPKSEEDLKQFLNNYGLEKVKMRYSTFGGCYFIEVKGEFQEDNILNKIETTAKDFNWNV